MEYTGYDVRKGLSAARDVAIALTIVGCLAGLFGKVCGVRSKPNPWDQWKEPDKKNSYVLDIVKSGSGKYFSQYYYVLRPQDSKSIREAYYNLDENPNTIEQYVRYVPEQGIHVFIPDENLIAQGFKPYNDVLEKKIRVMTKEEQERINQKFKQEEKFVEKDNLW
ncbi:MAG TPA: hypothetical protein VJ461_03295 [Candidatus Nanoarchaeia archaeon]|nr:hypothetical protein [Candidatus Nanoarchaeia archaeon]